MSFDGSKKKDKKIKRLEKWDVFVSCTEEGKLTKLCNFFFICVIFSWVKKLIKEVLSKNRTIDVVCLTRSKFMRFELNWVKLIYK